MNQPFTAVGASRSLVQPVDPLHLTRAAARAKSHDDERKKQLEDEGNRGRREGCRGSIGLRIARRARREVVPLRRGRIQARCREADRPRSEARPYQGHRHRGDDRSHPQQRGQGKARPRGGRRRVLRLGERPAPVRQRVRRRFHTPPPPSPLQRRSTANSIPSLLVLQV